MKKMGKKLGFTAVELLVTLFVAAAFLLAGYQLYLLIIKDGGESRMQARASNVAYDYLQRYKPAVTVPCSTSTPLSNQSITVANLSNVTVTVQITCPYGTTAAVSKVIVNLNYNNPQQTISNATYVSNLSIVKNGLVLNLDAGVISSYSGTGTTWSDLSGNNNNGTLINGVGYSSSNGGALSFDGVDDYVNCGNGASLNIGNNMTIGAWIKPSSLSARFDVYSDRLNGAAGAFQLEIGVGSGGTNRASVTTPGIFRAETSDDALAVNVWQYLVYTESGTTQNIYVNGNNQNIISIAASHTDNTDPKVIGYGSTQHFVGLMGDIHVYNHALSGVEIQQNFNALRGRYGI
jgi:Tfp pilus assembly protein PilE